MTLINFLTGLLVKAYRKEAQRIQREAEKLGKLQAAEALEAVELARAAEAAREQSVELGVQKRHAEDKAIGVAARAARIENLFHGE